MGLEIFQVDAFADRPFRGNPAAVCILPGPRDDAWLQDVAREMNLAETAFLLKGEDGYQLRWFTPATEVDLCGHATLASAHVLWETGVLGPGAQARFHTRSGLLTADRNGTEIELDFPATPESAVTPPPGLADALGVPVIYAGESQFDLLVEVDGEESVRALKPDLAVLGRLPVRGIIVTSLATGQPYDFVSRFFAPAAGVDEDPVTGSAHCCLGPFWGGRLGKEEMLAYQASARGGFVRVRLAGDRVRLGGRAVTVLRGVLLAP
jgi:PhzF family phenazine biosynthesis protein